MAELDEEDGSYYLQLCKDPVRFEPVSRATSVFFDDSNRQVFAVRAGGTTGVVVKGPDEKTNITFRMEDRGEVISIKFSPDRRILGVQRSRKSVEFINFNDDTIPDVLEYSQTCKSKSTQIRGFCWCNSNEITFVADQAIEFYQISAEKKTLKCLKTFSLNINWFVWLPGNSVLLLSSGSQGNTLNPFWFKPGTVNRLPKFDVDLPIVSPKISLLQRDVTMAYLYGVVYIIVLRHQPKSGNFGAEIVLYQLQKESPAKKTDVLRLDMSGRFAVNAIDNLLIVHHQASRTSMIFDIKLGGELDNYLMCHHPVLSPLPIKPFRLLLPPAISHSSGAEKTQYTFELYSDNWIVFQPDIIIDAKLGSLWYVQLRLEPLVEMIPDKCRLIEFLLLRKDSKMVILSVCRQMLIPGQQASLTVIARIYDMLNEVYKNYQEMEIQTTENMQSRQEYDHCVRVIIDQSDMYTHVLSVFEDSKNMENKFIVAVLIEYIRSLNQYQIAVQHYLYELIINILVHHNCFYQLHQFLQYHVLSDSKPLACLMLSLEGVYPPAHQLALDMMKRLSTANEEIIEVLLSKQHLLPALRGGMNSGKCVAALFVDHKRFIRSIGVTDSVSARKFLEAALNSEDHQLFYTVFKFFEQRNLRLRGSARFPQGEHCEQYVQHFESLFGTEALELMVSN